MDTANPLNPWLSIWTKPRQTIRQVQQTYSIKQIIWLWIAAQSIQFMFKWFDKAPRLFDSLSIEYSTEMLWLYGIGIAPFFMLVGLLIGWFMLWLFKIIAHKFGSAAQMHDLVYLAWPSIINVPLYIPFFLLGLLLPTLSLSENQEAIIIVIVGLIAGIWLIIAGFLCIAEILELSKWRTFACCAINLIIWLGFMITITLIMGSLFMPKG